MIGRHSAEHPPSELPTETAPAPRCYIGRTWAVHAALGAITAGDRLELGADCDELIVSTLATSAVLNQVFSTRELADASLHPATHTPLTERQADLTLAIGVRCGLIKPYSANDTYHIADEALREHVVALFGWLHDLPLLYPPERRV